MKATDARFDQPTTSEQASTLARLFLLVAPICWIIYANSLSNGFVFDDAFTVIHNQSVRHFDLARLVGNWYRPVRDLSLAIDYWWWGLHPAGFRLTNILIHSLNSCLVLVLAFKVVRNLTIALFAALIFAVHPIQTDAVTYISGRRDVLFALFYFLSFYTTIRFREEGRWHFAALSVAAFLLSLMTKEMAVTLPAVILLWELYRRWETSSPLSVPGQLIMRTWEVIKAQRWTLSAGVLVLAAFLARYMLTGRGLGSERATQLEYWGGSFWKNFLTVLTVHAHYLKLLLWPAQLVASYQGAFPIAHSMLQWPVILSSIILLGLVIWMVLSLKRDKVVSFSVAFYFISLLPVSQIIPHHELLAEHYLYLPMFGFSLLIGLLLQKLALRSQTWRLASYACFVLIICVLGGRTIIRNHDWKDAFTLWQATYEAVPNSPRAAYNLGVEYMRRNQFQVAAGYLKRAIELEPTHILAYNNLAAANLALGKPQMSLELLQRAMELKPGKDRTVWGKRASTYRMILRNMAKAYVELDQPENALEALRQAIEIYSGDASSYSLLAQVHKQLNQIGAAIDACRQGLVQDPSSDDLHLALAGLLISKGRLNDAAAEWQAVTAHTASHPRANIHLALRALIQGDAESARRHIHRAIAAPITEDQLKDLLFQSAANYPRPQSILLVVETYQLLGRQQQAIDICQAGLAQYPRDRTLRLRLAYLFASNQEIEEAAAEWVQVTEDFPDDFSANLNLGGYFLSKGDQQRAQNHLDIALASAPDEASRQRVLEIMQQLK